MRKESPPPQPKCIRSCKQEDLLWLGLAVWLSLTPSNSQGNPSDEDIILLSSVDLPSFVSLLCAFWTFSSNGDNKTKNKNTPSQEQKNLLSWKGRQNADSGSIMSMVLIPACLEGNQKYASLMVLMGHEYAQSANGGWTVVAGLAVVIARLWFIFFHQLVDKNNYNLHHSTSSIIDLVGFIIIWWALSHSFQRRPTFESCLTVGEFRILISLGTICLLEWIKQTVSQLLSTNTTTLQSPSSYSYAIVALSGVVGCAFSLMITSLLSSSSSLPWQIMINGIGPLMMVEVGLWLCTDGNSTYPNHKNSNNNLNQQLPLWCQWILDFLQSPEKDEDVSWPRYYGLIYWFIILVILLIPPILQIISMEQKQMQQKQASNGSWNDSTINVVVRRKWFHLIAVLLFGPVERLFPQLLSLSYAIALCGLAILESLRRQIPAIQWFYKGLIDPQKDNPDNVMFSHIFLVLGCAMPLWTGQQQQQQRILLGGETNDGTGNNLDPSINVILCQWGVLSLGVGDAMGALVGTYFGRHRWGRNRRTLEGSAAMWLSMMCTGGIILVLSKNVSPSSSLSAWSALLFATTFTTCIEAYTLQMDNLILPLAGSVILSRLQ